MRFRSMRKEQVYIGEEGEWFTSMMEEQLYIGEEGEWGIRLQVRTDA